MVLTSQSSMASTSRGAVRRNVLHCRNHPDAALIEDYHAGDMICSQCGLVVGDRVIDVGSEWRTFSNDKNSKDMSRVGASEDPLLEGGDLTTRIQTSGYEDSGYKNRKNVSSADRNLQNAFREMSQMADRLNLPTNIIDRAKRLFKEINDSKALKGGASNDAIAAACVYISCRQEGVPRTFKEICAVSKVSKKEIGRTFKKIIRTLETSLELITTGDFMSRFCSNLGLPSVIQRAATHIAKRAAELDLCSGRSPISVAAAAIYMASQASDHKKTQKEIGDIAGVAEVTLTKSYKLMRPRASELFPEGFQFAVPVDQLPQQ